MSNQPQELSKEEAAEMKSLQELRVAAGTTEAQISDSQRARLTELMQKDDASKPDKPKAATAAVKK